MRWITYLPTLAMASSQALIRHKAVKLTEDAAQAQLTLSRIDKINALKQDAALVKRLLEAKTLPDVVTVLGAFTLDTLTKDIEKKHPHLRTPPEPKEEITPVVTYAERFAQALFGGMKPEHSIYSKSFKGFPRTRVFIQNFPVQHFPAFKKPGGGYYSANNLEKVFFFSGNCNPSVEDYLSEDAVYIFREDSSVFSVLYHTPALISAAEAAGHKYPFSYLHLRCLQARDPVAIVEENLGIPHFSQPVINLLQEAWTLAESRKGMVRVLIQGSPGTGKTQSILNACAQGGWHLLECGDWEGLATGVHTLNPYFDVYCLDDIERDLTPAKISTLLRALDRDHYTDRPSLLILTSNNIQKIPAAVRRPGRIDFVLDMDRILPSYGKDEILALWDRLFSREKVAPPPLCERQIEEALKILQTGFIAAAKTYLERVKLYGQDYEMPPWDMSFSQPPSLDPHEVYTRPESSGKRASTGDANFDLPKEGDVIRLSDGRQVKVGKTIWTSLDK